MAMGGLRKTMNSLTFDTIIRIEEIVTDVLAMTGSAHLQSHHDNLWLAAHTLHFENTGSVR